MEDFGSDFITITDEDGVEYELEILSELDYQGAHYLAVVPAMDSEEEPEELEVSLLRADEEEGEPHSLRHYGHRGAGGRLPADDGSAL